MKPANFGETCDFCPVQGYIGIVDDANKINTSRRVIRCISFTDISRVDENDRSIEAESRRRPIAASALEEEETTFGKQIWLIRTRLVDSKPFAALFLQTGFTALSFKTLFREDYEPQVASFAFASSRFAQSPGGIALGNWKGAEGNPKSGLTKHRYCR